MMPRFVILHHLLADSEHWDLMLERGDVLLTWQLLSDPTIPGGIPAPARRIGDHRKAYLEYEGPISGDRGRVARVDSGALEIHGLGPDSLAIRLSGTRISGYFSLTRVSADQWTFARRTGPPEASP